MKNIKDYFSDVFLRRTYLHGLGFIIFYGAIALAPLFFEELGTSVSSIGLYLGLSAIPWIILEFPIGKWADKTHKERNMFILTYVILIPSLVLFGLSRTEILAFFFLLLTSIATSLSETTTLSHFYRHVPEKQIGKISVFLTFSSFGLFIGTLYISIALTITNLNTAYVVLGILLLPFLFNAIKLRKMEITEGMTAD